MKKWVKRIALTTALGGVGIIGYNAPAIYTVVDSIPDHDKYAFGYDLAQSTMPMPGSRGILNEKVVQEAEELHKKINLSAAQKEIFDIYNQDKVPYGVQHIYQQDFKIIRQNFADQVEGKSEIQFNPDIFTQTTLHFVDKGNELYKKLKTALNIYNHKHPNAKTSMPRFVAIADSLQGGLAYHGGDDLFIIDKNLLNTLDKDEFQAMAIHELRHKVQIESGIYNITNTNLHYLQSQHTKYMGDKAKKACNQAGLNDDEIAKLLPSELHSVTITLDPNSSMPGFEYSALKTSDKNEWTKSAADFLEMTQLKFKQKTNEECNVAVGEILDSQATLIDGKRLIKNQEHQKIELDADLAGAESISPQAMANAILKLSQNSGIKYTAESSSFVAHPADQTRLASFGCQQEGFVAKCDARKASKSMLR